MLSNTINDFGNHIVYAATEAASVGKEHPTGSLIPKTP
jgi:hypothetical protein